MRAAQEGLVEAEGRVEIEAQRVSDFERRIGEAANRIGEIDRRLVELHGSTRRLEELRESRLATGRLHLKAIEERSAAQQRVNVIEARKAEMEKVREEIFEYKREAGYFRELAECFGQRGVQAMLIEQVMPEVEGYANELLDLRDRGSNASPILDSTGAAGIFFGGAGRDAGYCRNGRGGHTALRAIQWRGGVSRQLRDPDRDQQAADAPGGNEAAVPGDRRGVRLARRGRPSAA